MKNKQNLTETHTRLRLKVCFVTSSLIREAKETSWSAPKIFFCLRNLPKIKNQKSLIFWTKKFTISLQSEKSSENLGFSQQKHSNSKKSGRNTDTVENCTENLLK